VSSYGFVEGVALNVPLLSKPGGAARGPSVPIGIVWSKRAFASVNAEYVAVPLPETVCALISIVHREFGVVKPLSLRLMINGAAAPLVVALIELRSIAEIPGPLLRPLVKLMLHAPTTKPAGVETAPPAPIKMGLQAPLQSWSSMFAIAVDANPAANSGPAASATRARTFLLIAV
jgi:hypothetical protein